MTPRLALARWTAIGLFIVCAGVPTVTASAQEAPRTGGAAPARGLTQPDPRSGGVRSGPGQAPAVLVEVGDIVARTQQGRQALAISLRNSGKLPIELRGTLLVATKRGEPLQSLPLELGPIAPNATVDHVVTVGGSELAPGEYTCTLALAGRGFELRHMDTLIVQSGPAPDVQLAASGTFGTGVGPPTLPRPGLPRLELSAQDLPAIPLLQTAQLTALFGGALAYLELRRRMRARVGPSDARVAALTTTWMAVSMSGVKRPSPLAGPADAPPRALPVPSTTTPVDQVSELVRSGQAAARTGDRQTAYRCFVEALRFDDRCEEAWLWLAGILDTPRDVMRCLERVIELNPDNQHARRGLSALRASLAG